MADQGSVAGEPARDRERTPPPQFLREVRSEMRKVAWPNRREVLSYTIVVLVVTAILVAYTFGLDELFRRAVLNTLG